MVLVGYREECRHGCGEDFVNRETGLRIKVSAAFQIDRGIWALEIFRNIEKTADDKLMRCVGRVMISREPNFTTNDATWKIYLDSFSLFFQAFDIKINAVKEIGSRSSRWLQLAKARRRFLF